AIEAIILIILNIGLAAAAAPGATRTAMAQAGQPRGPDTGRRVAARNDYDMANALRIGEFDPIPFPPRRTCDACPSPLRRQAGPARRPDPAVAPLRLPCARRRGNPAFLRGHPGPAAVPHHPERPCAQHRR